MQIYKQIYNKSYSGGGGSTSKSIFSYLCPPRPRVGRTIIIWHHIIIIIVQQRGLYIILL